MSQHANLPSPEHSSPEHSSPEHSSPGRGATELARHPARPALREQARRSATGLGREPASVGLSFRLVAAALAATPMTLLLVASHLQPNSAGLGTHQQLGLPPCSMRVIFGVRCPSCGMTTSWAYFMNGQWADSFQVNSGGFLLALLSIAFASCALKSTWTGQLPAINSQRLMAVSLLAVAAVTLVDWILRLGG